MLKVRLDAATRQSDIDLNSFSFRSILTEHVGGPPAGMIEPHAHHILFKKGLGEAQQELVQEGQTILRKAGIDPIFGPENLVWAPLRAGGQHGPEALENVVSTLRSLDGIGSYRDFVEALEELGQLAARRK